MNEQNETIVALSTPLGVGAISIVRMSGENAINIADSMFLSLKNKKPSDFMPRKLELGTLTTAKFTEKVLCVVFRCPNSYTGEDLVEFQCHGGVKIAEGVIEECLNSGAKMATSGEFSKRAFINGKMDLAMAEGMMNMINAQSDAEIRAGFSLLDGELGKITTDAQKKLTDLLAEIEVSLDYPEEDIEYIAHEKLTSIATTIKKDIDNLIATSNAGRQISKGINLLILGEPNVGKSSLLNALIGKNRAIVTQISGTTRDIIEESLEINGVKFNIIDTAGIRETSDIIEQIGIDKAKEKIKSADLVLVMVDASKPQSEKDREVMALTENKSRLIVGNKIDLTSEPLQPADIYISTQNPDNIKTLKDKIYALSADNEITNGVVITSLRHLDALKRASTALSNAINAADASLDLISIDLKTAYTALGEITGNTTNEDIINAIFSKFCLGK